MDLLFVTLSSMRNISAGGIYADLMREFRDRGDNVHVVCPRERRHGLATECSVEDGIQFLRVKTGNITKCSVIEKGIATLLLEYQFVNAIARYFPDVRFDLVLYSTPPVTFQRAVKFIKERDGCLSYLMLKDIFPQNAVDLGMMRHGSMLWRYFRSKEKKLYEISDVIGCMSKANVEYLVKHNPQIDPGRVEECPNSIAPKPIDERKGNSVFRGKYGIPKDAVLFVYGGNLGKPQGLGFLLRVLDRIKDRPDVFFLVVGSGTEYPRLQQHIQASSIPNAMLLPALPKDEYDDLVQVCDVGLIFLDPRFTIPNFPSRLTSYMEACLPVLAATDVNTDIKDVLEESGCGLWVENGDLEGFVRAVEYLCESGSRRADMGMNGRRYLEKYYTVSRTYDIITSHVKNRR